jgi:hypothetical protein
LKKNKSQISGIKKLAVWKTAESKAASVLDVLVRNGTISNAEKNLNLYAATLAILDSVSIHHQRQQMTLVKVQFLSIACGWMTLTSIRRMDFPVAFYLLLINLNMTV